MRAKPNGFKLVFTQPVDATSAIDANSYLLHNYTYTYSEAYGSDEIDSHKLTVSDISLSEDHLSVHLSVEGLKPHYVHELHAKGIRNQNGEPLLHPEAYYTLNQIPKQ